MPNELWPINLNLSTDPDRVSAVFKKKKLSYVLYPVITYLYNSSLNCSIFPDIWKVSYVIPIFKNC